jgi:16S rRNA (cytosine967-C5)-methyltransferase
MHPNDFLDDCTQLLTQALNFDQALDACVGQFFSHHRRAGSREREGISSAVYTFMRQRRLIEHLAQSGHGSMQRRYAILGMALSHEPLGSDLSEMAVSPTLLDLDPAQKAWSWRNYLAGALSAQESDWLNACLATSPGTLPCAMRHNLPDWLAQALTPVLGEELYALVNALEPTDQMDVRVAQHRAKRKDVLARLTAAHIACSETPYSPWGLRLDHKVKLAAVPDYQQGLIEVQDEGSQLLALLVDAKRNETIVDFCAGAGGKTLALGAMMRNTGRIVACDTSLHRLEGLAPRLAKSGLNQVHTMAIAHENDERLQRLYGKMDRVLVDAPCSGLGTLKRNPALKWRQTPKTVASLAQLQTRILESAAQLLKPGGRLVYATCSLLQDENEAIASQFGANHRNFKAVPVGAILDKAKVPLATSLCNDVHEPTYLRLWPHRHHTDGFFAAVWERKI